MDSKKVDKENNYWVLAYYYFTNVPDPQEEVKRHKQFFENRDVSGRIYISKEGINGQMSGYCKDAQAYMDWMKESELFQGVKFKIHYYPENAFPKMTVKVREQVVAMDTSYDLSKQGEHVSPKRWREMLESEDDYLLLDVRNDYEWEVGHFDGAELPPLKQFRDFPRYAEELKEKVDPKETKVMMYCTGGIRCELYSALMKEKGFENVYQLDGGVINYGLQEGTDHWKGKLFVFDDRLTVPISEEGDAPVVGKCRHCGEESESYYNCAHMDCNELFLSCPDCLEKYQGCCDVACTGSPRIRPLQEQNAHKPFRRWYKYFSKKPVS